MKKPYKRILRVLGAIALAGLLGLAGVGYLQTRTPDFWRYSKGMSDGTAQSPVFFVDVCGVGHRPTIAYVVRCPDQSNAPKNLLDVSQSVTAQVAERTRVMDRWRSECILLVGRRVGEIIPIPLDKTSAQQWLGRPNAAVADFTECQKFWDEFVSPRIAAFDRSNR